MSQKNFGETLTYWYLRLNGFVPLSNYVLHQNEQFSRTADCDMLGVRFPYVYEKIGGQPNDWDYEFFGPAELPIDTDIVGLIVEVKTGYEDNPTKLINKINQAFGVERLSYAVKRLGFWIPERADEIVRNLLVNEPVYREIHSEDGLNITVAKLWISTYFPENERIPPCYTLTLKHLEDFICKRMEIYRNRKYRDRNFFPDDLIQYLIWKCAS